jgi:hypothetical protein
MIKMSTFIPGDIFVELIFPKLNVSEILQLASIQPHLIPYAKKYIVDLGKRLRIPNVNNYNELMSKLTIKKIYDEFVMNLILDLYHLVVEYSDSSVKKRDFLNRYESRLWDGYFDFEKDLAVITEKFDNKRFIKPEYFKNFQDRFENFRNYLSQMQLDFYFDYFYNHYEGDDEYDPNLKFSTESFDRIVDENLRRLI